MKVKVENRNEGVCVLQILEDFKKEDMHSVIQEVEKSLGNGKTRIVIAFPSQKLPPSLAQGVELTLRHFQLLARKMGGDIVYSVPSSLDIPLPNSVQSTELAIQKVIKGKGASEIDKSDLTRRLDVQAERIKLLEKENLILQKKTKELLDTWVKPGSDAELRAAMEFYRNLSKGLEVSSNVEKPAAPQKPSK